VTPTNAYDELSGLRLDVGRGYDRRSVETFRARALGIVDDLLRRVTELEDRLAAGGESSLSAPEMELVNAFRSADPSQQREAVAMLLRSSTFTWSPADSATPGDDPAPEIESAGGTEFDDWLHSFNAAPTTEVVDLDTLDPVVSETEPETESRLPLRVAPVEGSTDAPPQPTPWAGWVD
jgi:hypothetical protein